MKTFKVHLIRHVIQVAIMDVEADSLEVAINIAENCHGEAVWDDDDRLPAEVERVKDGKGAVVWRKP